MGARCYVSLGAVCYPLGEYRKSKQYLDKALAILIKIGYRLGEADCYGGLGDLFLALGRKNKKE